MSTQPKVSFFVDGQNLFHSVKNIFGYSHPNYDIMAICREIAGRQGWQLGRARFYTGVPAINESPRWHEFWAKKLAQMGRQGVDIFSRQLRYRSQKVSSPNGQDRFIRVADEKGIDVRIAIDIIRAMNDREFDVAVIFSQDQDLAEVVDEVKRIAKDQGRAVRVVCAFPITGDDRDEARRGINGSEWMGFRKQDYDRCIDPRAYLPDHHSSAPHPKRH